MTPLDAGEEQEARERVVESLAPLRVARGEPPLYTATVRGRELELTGAHLESFNIFKRQCIQVLDFVPLLPEVADAQGKPLPRREVWDRIVHRALAEVVVEEAPPPAMTREGLVWERISRVLDDVKRTTCDRQKILDGKVFETPDSAYVRLQTLRELIGNRTAEMLSQGRFWQLLRSKGCGSVSLRLGPEYIVRVLKVPRAALEETGSVDDLEERAWGATTGGETERAEARRA